MADTVCALIKVCLLDAVVADLAVRSKLALATDAGATCCKVAGVRGVQVGALGAVELAGWCWAEAVGALGLQEALVCWWENAIAGACGITALRHCLRVIVVARRARQ